MLFKFTFCAFALVASLVSAEVSSPTNVVSAQAAAEEVYRQAQIASGELPDDPHASKSYGVGGAIVENVTGRIVHAWGNRVNGQLASGMWFAPLDPTNHGETQLVAWFYENRLTIQQQLGLPNLPQPPNFTVVTSLDPCAMCAGALLTAGFNVAVIAPDASGGGVNWAGTGEFAHVPPAVRSALRNLFGYYRVTAEGDDDQVTGVSLRADYFGGSNVIYREEAITESIYNGNYFVFDRSTKQVSDIRKATRPSLADLADIHPAGGLPTNGIAHSLTNRWSNALTVKLDTRIPDEELMSLGIKTNDLPKKNYFRPNNNLYQLLRNALTNAPGSENALAMIDPFGNVLAVEVDRPTVSPIATAMMNTVSGYSRFAFGLISDASIHATNISLLKQTPAYRYLSPVSCNTFIYLKAPTPNRVTTLKDLGIFGNTSDGVLQYIEPPVDGTMKELDDQVWSMPLYYIQSENVSAVQSMPLPPDVQLTVTTLAESGPGSLREAIALANAGGHYRRIAFADNLQGTMVLSSAFPTIQVPVSIDGRASAANPFAPRFAAAPRVGIDFNNQAGLNFAAAAIGSQVIGLALGGSGDYAISSLTRNLEITQVRFGVNQAGVSRPNALGWFGGVANQAVISLSDSPLLTLSRLSDVTRPLVFSENTTIARRRLDSHAGPIYVGFSQGTDYFPLEPSGQGALTNAVTTGSRSPAAVLPNEQPLTLTWLGLIGGTATAEFALAPNSVLGQTNQAALLPYLGKTWTVSLNVAAATSRPSYTDWVGAWGLSPAISDGSADPDGDGFDNQKEFAFGGNPTHPTPNLIQMSGSSIQYLGLIDDETSYTVQTTTNLATGIWTHYPLPQNDSSDQLNIPLAGFYQRKQLSVPITNGTRGFFRVTFQNP